MATPLDLYAASNWGPMKVAPFNASVGAAIRYKITLPDGVSLALFVIKSTKAFRLLQDGVATVTASATNAGKGSAATDYPLTVEKGKNEYISILGDTDAGDLEIKLDSGIVDWSIAVVP